MVDQSVVAAVQNYLRQLQARGIEASFGVVFGSWATGKAHEWSDIDLVVVSPYFNASQQRQGINILWQVAADVDSRIEPIACGEQQWFSDTSSAIIEIARREGQKIILPASEPSLN